jgi:prepilin-type N-terminal cleavage/methylation domain-containing protein
MSRRRATPAMPAARRGRAQRGFTLLELLITLSVTTIGLIGLLSLHLSVARGNDGASRSAEAQQIGASQIEQLRAMSVSNMMFTLTGSTALAFPAGPQVKTVPGRSNMSFTVTSTVTQLTTASPSLIKIRVVTGWTEDGGTTGANGGQLDHQLALEVIRTLEESL